MPTPSAAPHSPARPWGHSYLTPPTALDPGAKAEIDRVLGGTGTVYLLGGLGAISAEVEAALTQNGYTVARLAGPDRFDTSVEVAEEVDRLTPEGHAQVVFATTGLNFPDGLAAGATAGGYWGSVVLTRDSVIPTTVQAYLDKMTFAAVHSYAVGGAAAKAPYHWQAQLVGADRYETAAIVADWFWAGTLTTADDPYAVGLATGVDWPDALAGGAFMAGWGPLVLSRTDSLPASTARVTQAMVASGEPSPVEYGLVFGGEDVVGPTPAGQFAGIIGG